MKSIINIFTLFILLNIVTSKFFLGDFKFSKFAESINSPGNQKYILESNHIIKDFSFPDKNSDMNFSELEDIFNNRDHLRLEPTQHIPHNKIHKVQKNHIMTLIDEVTNMRNIPVIMEPIKKADNKKELLNDIFNELKSETKPKENNSSNKPESAKLFSKSSTNNKVSEHLQKQPNNSIINSQNNGKNNPSKLNINTLPKINPKPTQSKISVSNTPPKTKNQPSKDKDIVNTKKSNLKATPKVSVTDTPILEGDDFEI